MYDLFTWFTEALNASALVALPAALLWGVLSILLSPCHLASIPLIVAFIDSQNTRTLRKALAISALFALGILITIALIGLLTAAAGRILGDLGGWSSYLVAGIFLLVGLMLLDVIPAPWKRPDSPHIRRRGYLAALVLGLVFGVALGPCTFAFMAPMLAMTFRLAETNLGYGLALLGCFAAGHTLVLILAGTFTGAVQRYLNWNERSRGAIILRKVCGLIVIVIGLYMLYIA